MAWTQHVDQLLYDGETEQRRVAFANATVVVTSQRVLVFTDGNGATYQQVDRPNVRRVTVDTGGETRHLVRAVLPAVVGSVLLAFGAALTRIDLVPDSGVDGDDVQLTDDGTGVSVDTMSDVTDGLFSTVETLLTVFELGTMLLGVLSLAAATVLVGCYARSRTRTAVLRVSGDDDLEVPVSDADIEDGLVTALKEAVRPGLDGGLEPDGARFEDGDDDLERASGDGASADGDRTSVDDTRPVGGDGEQPPLIDDDHPSDDESDRPAGDVDTLEDRGELGPMPDRERWDEPDGW